MMVFYPSIKKEKNDLLPKNTLKDDISSITEKDDIHPRKYGIFSDRKINPSLFRLILGIFQDFISVSLQNIMKEDFFHSRSIKL